MVSRLVARRRKEKYVTDSSGREYWLDYVRPSSKGFNVIVAAAYGYNGRATNREDFDKLFEQEKVVLEDEILILAHRYHENHLTGCTEEGMRELEGSRKRGMIRWRLYEGAGDAAHEFVRKALPEKELTWEDLLVFFPSGNFIDDLSPLYLSLQAYFGLSRDEKSKHDQTLVYIGKDDSYSEKMKNSGISKANRLDTKYTDLFPNTDAFMLVYEAEYDFYAPILDKVLPKMARGKISQVGYNESSGEQYAYRSVNMGDELKVLSLEKALDDNLRSKLQVLMKAFEEKYAILDYSTFGGLFQDSAAPKVFVNVLRELCAIMANTDDKDATRKAMTKEGSGKKEMERSFAYKGDFAVERNAILKSLGEPFLKRHSKLPDDNDRPTESYRVLVEQLNEWGSANGYQRLNIILQGMAELADVINEVMSLKQ